MSIDWSGDCASEIAARLFVCHDRRHCTKAGKLVERANKTTELRWQRMEGKTREGRKRNGIHREYVDRPIGTLEPPCVVTKARKDVEWEVGGPSEVSLEMKLPEKGVSLSYLSALSALSGARSWLLVPAEGTKTGYGT